jgi:hypothetical protein
MENVAAGKSSTTDAAPTDSRASLRPIDPERARRIRQRIVGKENGLVLLAFQSSI